ncbi:hypothetical protein GCM10007874_08840 [Labrys miyagiensis]|uniref:Ribbon-helix-helix protein CopG domain-containing protein n=1 Tax=Labrys miyagiensis TaxID=346912 RepID=A0ABQ6CBW2_9HYPH|nr:ribbon-helix-helix protein, CopG family [Labrys miyagiensis]GLS17868.1 hypothetical protein GCM10007874_08840 [Labrys miyagiensis]
MPSKADTFSIRLPDDLKRDVARLATATRRSRAFIVKEAVAAYVEDQRDYLAALDEAAEEADKGIFVSEDRALSWLRSLGTEDEKPLPEADIGPDART